MKTKKGQTQQVFIYVMVILVAGAVMLFGYKAITNIIDKSCDVEMGTFPEEVKTTIEKNNGYGDVALQSFKAPCGYEIICFVNSSPELARINPNIEIIGAISSSMGDEISVGTGNNVFLIKGDTTKPLYRLDYIDVQGNSTAKGFLCIESKGGSFPIALEGLGKGRVKITERS